MLADCDGEPDVILIATGSEVHLALEAHEMLLIEGIKSRVVSLPSWHLFDSQDEEYRESVLPSVGHEPGRDRAGFDLRLGALRRRDRHDDRHDHLRRLRPRSRTWPEVLRLHARRGGRSSQGPVLGRLTMSRAPRDRRLAGPSRAITPNRSTASPAGSLRRRPVAGASRLTAEACRPLLRLFEEPDHAATRSACWPRWPRQPGMPARRDAMFRGEHINVSEDRAVLHVALRMPRSRSLVVDGVDVVREVHEVLDRMAAFCEKVRSGDWLGHTGKPIRNVINIGIGGSDLGPVMAYEALKDYSRRDMSFRFVSNVDGTDFYEATCDARPGGDALHRLLQDLHHARDDDQRRGRPASGCSTVSAATSRLSRSTSSPFRPTPRASPNSGSTPTTCSASGNGSAAAIRWIRRSASRPCWRSAPTASARCSTASTRWTSISSSTNLETNLPVIHGLLTVWYRNFFDAETQAVLPYSEYLHRFPAYLQQLTMESNGKSVTLDGEPGRLRRPERSSGANPEPTASIPSTS